MISWQAYLHSRFQSTLPQRERLLFLYIFPRSRTISIHAPTKGATRSYVWGCWILRISIHAPTKGATLSRLYLTPISLFQSTLPQRERRGCHCFYCFDCSDFNPRSHKGSDHIRQFNYAFIKISIHAPTKGATFTVTLPFSNLCSFQSTLPQRERLEKLIRRSTVKSISIHAPTKGATAVSG